MKKSLALFLGAIGLLGFLSPTFAQDFPDVPTSHSHYQAIQFMRDKGWVKGYPDGKFYPDKDVSRAELVKMLIEANKLKTDAGSTSGFSDVPANEWFAPYVAKAKKLNAIQGYADGTFKPGSAVKKIEAIKILLTLSRGEIAYKFESLPFTDVDQGQWYAKYINYAYKSGVLFERNRIFGVTSEASRGEIAEYLYRLSTGKEMVSSEDIATVKTSQDERSEYSEEQLQIMNLINEERKKAKTAGVELHQLLNQAAQAHFDDLNAHDDFSHTGSDGSNVMERIDRTGFAAIAVGENLGDGQDSAVLAIYDWMQSPMHKANILNSNYTHIGVWKGIAEETGAPLWVLVFAEEE